MYRMKRVLPLTLPVAPSAEPNPSPGARGGYVPDEGRARRRARQAALRLPRGAPPHISPYLPISPHLSPSLPTSPHLSPSLPISPYLPICLHVPISRHISPHLAASRRISQVHMTFEGAFAEPWGEVRIRGRGRGRGRGGLGVGVGVGVGGAPPHEP